MTHNKTKMLPKRFAKVTNRVYRGARPTEEQLEYLVDKYNIKTVIDLTKGYRRFLEKNRCHSLDIEFQNFSFTGIKDKKQKFLLKILETIDNKKNGNIYVHCEYGRDRTSLIIALYKVCYQDINVEDAWEKDVINFGHREEKFLYHNFKKMFSKFIEDFPSRPSKEK